VLVQHRDAGEPLRQVLRHEPAVDENGVGQTGRQLIFDKRLHLGGAVALDAQRPAAEVAADEVAGAASAVHEHGLHAVFGGPHLLRL